MADQIRSARRGRVSEGEQSARRWQSAPAGRWAAYLAAAWGLLFALMSFYWALGGRHGADTIGGDLERLALERNPAIVAALWVTGLLKMVGAVLALALVRPWGERLPRRGVVVLGWGVAVFLALYGAVLVIPEALVAGGIIKPAQPVAWKPLLWHLWVWDMSFLVWGVLFTIAVRGFARRTRRG